MPAPITPFVTLQHTLASPIAFDGIGLHSGLPVHLLLRPAEADTGICFVRTDISGRTNKIKANAAQVIDTRRGTSLGNSEGVQISTVEHLLAALLAHNIDNVQIEVDSHEIPTLDGCSANFSEKLQQTGLLRQANLRKFIKVIKPIKVQSGASYGELTPSDRFEIDLGISYENPLIGDMTYSFDVTQNGFSKEIAPARTFALRNEVDELQRAGYGTGGDLSNCIVVGEDRIENEEGLRFADEFVRHKILDAIGDLSLVGGFLLGRYRVRRAGHKINYLVVDALLKDPMAWEYVCFDG